MVFEGFLPYEVEGDFKIIYSSKLNFSSFSGHSLAAHGSSIYLIGGFDGFSVINTIIKHDMTTRKSEVWESALY